MIGINTTTKSRGTRDLAIELANIMAASKTMVASIGADSSGKPQYLMPTRESIFNALKVDFPLYENMFNLIKQNNPIMFKLNEKSRKWLKAMKHTIRNEAREGYSCGCDYEANEVIEDNSAATAICNATCSEHGGWNGQWTNDEPAAATGTSVCGCKSCAL